MCPRCGVEMKEGQVLVPIMVGFPDFPGDTGWERGCTVSDSGRSKLAPCLKCPECGHSVTVSALERKVEEL